MNLALTIGAFACAFVLFAWLIVDCVIRFIRLVRKARER
jgi:hypothetical protein